MLAPPYTILLRRSVFSLLKDQKACIYFLQETYSEPNDENVWKKEWGSEVFFSHGTKHSKGVCILINPTAQIQVNYSYSDNSGRIVLITISLSGHNLTLCNIYAPNNQANQLQFMQELIAQNAIVFRDMYLQCPDFNALNNNGID